MKNWWVSWYSTKDMGSFELHFPWWESGFRCEDEAATICAGIKADSEEHCKEIVMASYDKTPETIEWRFCEEKPFEWKPFSDRFPKAAWMQW